MSWSTINNAIHTTLSAVSGVGVVHKYRRLAVDVDVFRTLFVSGGKVNGWDISRVREDRQHFGNRITREFEIRGFYAMADAAASELTFQQLVENIMVAFELDQTLTGTVLQSELPNIAIQVQAEFLGLSVHHAVLTIRTIELRK
jgi:hypothetical protein